MNDESKLPLGKLPPELLQRMLISVPVNDPRVLLGPGIGLDCAVVDIGPNLLVFKSDPITFATDEIGWYAVQVCANDIATTGALPCWFLMTLLLPEGKTNPALALDITSQVYRACEAHNISVIGGHTEVTYGLDRPIILGTMVGEVNRERLITQEGARPGDDLLLTKGVPIETVSILAREFPERLAPILGSDDLKRASNFLHDPGISVLEDAQTAIGAGRVTAMHDPTEGGLAAALWELAEASRCTILFDPTAVYVPSLAKQICEEFEMDPLASIASGSLLLSAHSDDSATICSVLKSKGITAARIGQIYAGPASVQIDLTGKQLLPRPERDEIARIFES